MTTLPSLTLWQRWQAEATPFWKIMSDIGLGLGAAVMYCQQNVPAIPKTWLAVGLTISGMLILVCHLDVDFSKIIATGSPTLDSVAAAIPDLMDTVNSIHTNVMAIPAQIAAVKSTPVPDIAPLVTETAVNVPAIEQTVQTAVNNAAPPGTVQTA